MKLAISLSEMAGRGVEFEVHEAVAVAQALVESCASNLDLTPPLGPPALDNVYLGPDGSVVCRGCAITPAVSEIAILLEAMLPRDLPKRGSGALRYLLARALLEVDTPPFDSLAEFSAALARHERGVRAATIRGLFERFVATPARAQAPFPDRRRRSSSPAELRRRLREADRELYDALVATVVRDEVPPSPSPELEDLWLSPAPATVPPARRGPRAAAWIGAGAAAALVAFAGGYGTVQYIRQPYELAVRQAASEAQRRLHTSSLSNSAVSPVAIPPVAANPIARISDRPRPIVSPAFASNGSALFVPDEASARADGGLRVMSIGDDGARNYHIQLSPDGTRIAFDSDRDGVRGIYVSSRDGTNVRRVSGEGPAAIPRWSPDGERLAFARAEADRPHVWNLWLQTLGSGDARRLTAFRSGRTWSASWFPDGRRIAYAHEDRLAIQELETGSTQQFESPVRRRLVRTPAVSPDGQFVIFQVDASGAWLLDLTDGSMRCVLTDPTAAEFAWSPDGRRVAFHSSRDDQWGIWLRSR